MDKTKKTISIQELKGIVPKPVFPVSIEDMNNAIADAGATGARITVNDWLGENPENSNLL